MVTAFWISTEVVYFQQCLVVTISQQATAYYKPDCGTISSIEDVLLVVFGGQTTIYSIGDVLFVESGGWQFLPLKRYFCIVRWTADSNPLHRWCTFSGVWWTDNNFFHWRCTFCVVWWRDNNFLHSRCTFSGVWCASIQDVSLVEFGGQFLP